MTLYVPLFLQIAPIRLTQGYEVEGGLSEPATPARVAKEAVGYAHAGMTALGFQPMKNGR